MSAVSLFSSPERVLLQLASLDDRELLERIGRLVERERSATASLVAHLAEMDRRRLFLELGYSSLYGYCTQALHLSEHAAYKRIEAARVARRFPVLFARLAEGALHLSAVAMLAPVLSEENHEVLIEEAKHKTKREVEEIVARVRPADPVPSLVWRLPAQPVRVPEAPSAPAMADAEGRASLKEPALPPTSPEAPPPLPPPVPRPVLAPLAPDRYKVQFTASAEMRDRLLQAQALLRHKVPDGDIAQILDLARIALLEKTEARKIGKRKRKLARPAEKKPRSGEQNRSRTIPAEVRRAV